jgi:hypothetical protein
MVLRPSGSTIFVRVGICLDSDAALRSYARRGIDAAGMFGARGRIAMSVSSYVRKRLRLPSRLALMFGLGAISAAGASADVARSDTSGPLRVPQQGDKVFGELRLWSEAGRIYLSEDGGAAQELALGDTPEAQRLRRLLDERGAVADSPKILQRRIILVGGGGEGFHWPTGDNGAGSTSQSTRSTGDTGHQAHGGPVYRPRPANPGIPRTPNPAANG